jgi:hypothetical protein
VKRTSSIYPFGVYIDGSREVVGVALECLTAHIAIQIAYAILLINLDGDGLCVIAEQACELGRQRFAPLGALRLLGTLAFTLRGR